MNLEGGVVESRGRSRFIWRAVWLHLQGGADLSGGRCGFKYFLLSTGAICFIVLEIPIM